MVERIDIAEKEIKDMTNEQLLSELGKINPERMPSYRGYIVREEMLRRMTHKEVSVLNIEAIRDRIENIKKCVDDNESAHSKEDKLYVDVLKVIANGAEDAQELAEEALKARDIDLQDGTLRSRKKRKYVTIEHGRNGKIKKIDGKKFI